MSQSNKTPGHFGADSPAYVFGRKNLDYQPTAADSKGLNKEIGHDAESDFSDNNPELGSVDIYDAYGGTALKYIDLPDEALGGEEYDDCLLVKGHDGSFVARRDLELSSGEDILNRAFEEAGLDADDLDEFEREEAQNEIVGEYVSQATSIVEDYGNGAMTQEDFFDGEPLVSAEYSADGDTTLDGITGQLNEACDQFNDDNIDWYKLGWIAQKYDHPITVDSADDETEIGKIDFPKEKENIFTYADGEMKAWTNSNGEKTIQLEYEGEDPIGHIQQEVEDSYLADDYDMSNAEDVALFTDQCLKDYDSYMVDNIQSEVSDPDSSVTIGSTGPGKYTITSSSLSDDNTFGDFKTTVEDLAGDNMSLDPGKLSEIVDSNAKRFFGPKG